MQVESPKWSIDIRNALSRSFTPMFIRELNIGRIGEIAARELVKLKLNRAFIWRLSTKRSLSTLLGVPDRPFQPLYLSQLPGGHYRGAAITNDASL